MMAFMNAQKNIVILKALTLGFSFVRSDYGWDAPQEECSILATIKNYIKSHMSSRSFHNRYRAAIYRKHCPA